MYDIPWEYDPHDTRCAGTKEFFSFFASEK